MAITRHFLSPKEPTLEQAVRALSPFWKNSSLDLRDSIIVVPTRHAGRRLRERLAVEAETRGGGVLLGAVVTPPQLFQPAPKPDLVVGVQRTALWAHVLRQRSAEPILEGLSVASQATSNLRHLSLAQHLVALRDFLCEEGYDIRSFAQRAIREELEPDRWQRLAELEEIYLSFLRDHKLRDDVTEKLEAARNPPCALNVKRILVLFTPDPPPLALRALEAIQSKVEVHIYILAEESDAAQFDEWGRPRPEAADARVLPIPESAIEVCDDPLAAARSVCRTVAEIPRQLENYVVVFAGNEHSADLISSLLEREGIPAFYPAGKPIIRHTPFQIIQHLIDLSRSRSYAAFAHLVRTPPVTSCLARVTGCTPLKLLSALDEFQQRFLPLSADQISEVQDYHDSVKVIGPVWEKVSAWLQHLESGLPLSRALPKVLSEIFREEKSTPSLRECASVLNDALLEMAPAERWCANLQDQFMLLWQALEDRRDQPVRPTSSMDILGWLELLWTDAPVLLLTDMNDGVVPETVAPNPFLPDNLRMATSLRGNRERYARDCYILSCLLASRRIENVRFWVPRRSTDGNPLKPSRLLFQCADSELARRALLLFNDAPTPHPPFIRKVGWKLRLPKPDTLLPLRKIAVTHFRTYLECPFLFYLRHRLNIPERMEETAELAPQEMGNLCHELLHQFAIGPARESTNEDEILNFLEELVRETFALRFGRNPRLTLLAQQEWLLTVFRQFARFQAKWRGEGWKICAAEHKITLNIAGINVEGKIDRVDYHPKHGYQILDYKVTEQELPPNKAHLTRVREWSPTDPFVVQLGEHVYRWKDLQLPLYVRAWTQKYDHEEPVNCAYYRLSAQAGPSPLLGWENWKGDELIASAENAAKEIIKRVQRHVFWPPAKLVYSPGETFYTWFFDSVEAALDPDLVNALKRFAESEENVHNG